MLARLCKWLFAKMFRKELEGTATLDMNPFCLDCGGLTAYTQESISGQMKFKCAACGSELFFRGWGASRDKAIVYCHDPEETESPILNYPRVEA